MYSLINRQIQAASEFILVCTTLVWAGRLQKDSCLTPQLMCSGCWQAFLSASLTFLPTAEQRTSPPACCWPFDQQHLHLWLGWSGGGMEVADDATLKRADAGPAPSQKHWLASTVCPMFTSDLKPQWSSRVNYKLNRSGNFFWNWKK